MMMMTGLALPPAREARAPPREAREAGALEAGAATTAALAAAASPARDHQAREAKDHPARGAAMMTTNPGAPGARVTMVMMDHGATTNPLASQASLLEDGEAPLASLESLLEDGEAPLASQASLLEDGEAPLVSQERALMVDGADGVVNSADGVETPLASPERAPPADGADPLASLESLLEDGEAPLASQARDLLDHGLLMAMTGLAPRSHGRPTVTGWLFQ
jgi:hypothetical protein